MMPRTITPKIHVLFAFEPEKIAHQMSFADWNLYHQICHTELLDQAWCKMDRNAKAPHVLSSIQWFNHLSSAFSTAILSTPSLKQRVEVVGRVIQVAGHLEAVVMLICQIP